MKPTQLPIPATKAAILARLQRDILPLQGYKPLTAGAGTDMGLGPIVKAFPQASFPLAAIHEFVPATSGDSAATNGFVAGLLAPLVIHGGAVAWITTHRLLFPPALRRFGLRPDQVIFIHPKKEKELLWAVEEALKCNALAAVVGEL